MLEPPRGHNCNDSWLGWVPRGEDLTPYERPESYPFVVTTQVLFAT